MIHALIVEDEVSHSELIRRRFASHSDEFALTVVRTLREARDAIKQKAPDILFVDYVLPDGYGTQLLKESLDESEYPTVVMTSQGDEEVAVEMIKSGAIDYLVKSDDTFKNIVWIAQRALREWDHIVHRRLAERQLQQSELTFRSITESIKEGIILIGEDGLIRLVNSFVEDNFGYSRDEILGESIELLVPDSYQLSHIQHRTTYMQSPHPIDVVDRPKLRAKRKDGSTFPVEVSLAPITIGDEVLVLCVVLDITSRMQAQEELQRSEERFRSLVNAMDDVVYTLDHDQRHTGVYGRWVEKTGFGSEYFLGRSAREMFGEEGSAVHDAANLQALSGESAIYRWEFEQNGDVLHYQTRVSPIFDAEGQVTGIVGIGRDISELELIKQELEETNRLLEARVRERTEKLDKANQMLLELVNMREAAQIRDREHRHLLESIQAIAVAMNSSLDIDQVLESVTVNIGEIVPHDALAMIVLPYESLPEVIQLYPARSAEVTGSDSDLLAIERGKLLEVYSGNNNAVLIEDLTSSPLKDLALAEKYKSLVGVGLRTDNEIIGYITLLSKEHDFYSPTDVQHLEIFAGQVTIAIRNAQLYEHAGQLAVLQDRQRLARDLHDAVTQTLFSASILSDSLMSLWETKPEKVKDHLVHLNQLTQGALAEMRGLLVELRPHAIADTEFVDLIEQLKIAFYNRTGIRFQFEMHGVPHDPLPTNIKETLYRLIQEALNNISKHAHAKAVKIGVQFHQDGVKAVIEDDGIGFDTTDTMVGTSMGLRIMHERVATIGATMSVESNPGKGTRISIDWKREDK